MMNEDQLLKSVSNIEISLRDIDKQLTIMNGSVKRNAGDIVLLKSKLRKVEDEYVEKDGFEKGKLAMKASTKTIIIVSATIISCMFTGIAIFKNSNAKLIKEVQAGMGDRFTGRDGKQLFNRIQEIEETVKEVRPVDVQRTVNIKIKKLEEKLEQVLEKLEEKQELD